MMELGCQVSVGSKYVNNNIYTFVEFVCYVDPVVLH